jgi:hypothetical protein
MKDIVSSPLMKTHLVTIILLILAALAFGLRFFVGDSSVVVCDIAAFALPTFAAIVEIVLSEKSGKKIQEEISKRPIWKSMTQKEYEELKEQGKIEEDTFYATFDE